MRLVFVNQVHPQTPHVSAKRIGEFAGSMAAFGHQVVVLTGSHPDRRTDGGTGALSARLAAHDWSKPLLAEVDFLPSPARSLPKLLRRAHTAWQFVAQGGVSADWTRAAEPLAREIATVFRPDLVWSTFGSTSNLTLGKRVAGLAGVPWVLDVKDHWRNFVPAGLRRLMAWRFRSAALMTANAEIHRDVAARWFKGMKSRVVYSGVSEAFFAERHVPRVDTEKRVLMLVGSLYRPDEVDRFLDGIRQWRLGLDDRERSLFQLVYAGSDRILAEEALIRADLSDCAVILGQVSIDELADHLHRATACCYIWNLGTFHHKLLELLVAGRQVIAFPGEHEESIRLAEPEGDRLQICRSPNDLSRTLTAIWHAPDAPQDARDDPPWRWSDFAVGLETAFQEVISTGAHR